MISRQQLTAFCLLAHINDNDRGINDLIQIFIPLVIKSIVIYQTNGKTSGNLNDLKNEFDRLFSLDIPYGMLTKLLHIITSKSSHYHSKQMLTLYNDGSFVINNHDIYEIDELYDQQDADISLVEEKYSIFLINNNLNKNVEPSIFEFLDSHHRELSGFFASRTNTSIFSNNRTEYTIPALFVDSVRNDTHLYSILRKIYLGSIISSYIRINNPESTSYKMELLLDTSFLISLLDLSSTEAHHTCQYVIDVAHKLRWDLKTLSITIEETQSLLRRSAESIGISVCIASLAPTSIEAGCARRKLTKTAIQLIASSLEQQLKKVHNINIVKLPEHFIRKAQSSEIYQKISSRSYNPDGAHHDGVAAYYVAEKRGKMPRSFFDSRCWFVSSHNPHRESTLRTRDDGTFFETIRAEYLLNIMWLSNPSINALNISAAGLSKLVASTIEKSMPSPQILREFDENLNKYGPQNITPEQVALLAQSAACRSADNLDRLNTMAREGNDLFPNEILSIIDEQRNKMFELATTAQNERLNRGKAEEENEKMQNELRKLTLLLLKSKESERTELNERLNTLRGLQRKSETKFKSKWGKRIFIYISVQILLLIGVLISLNKYGWPKMAPWAFIAFTFTPFVLQILCISIREKKFNTWEAYSNFIEHQKNKTNESCMAEYNLKYDLIDKLESDIGFLDKEIGDIIEKLKKDEVSLS